MARSVSIALVIACLACTGESARASSGEVGSSAVGSSAVGSSGAVASSGAERPAAREAPVAVPHVVFEVPGIGEVRVRVEIARTPAQRARGLMYRRSLDADAGMLFVYPYARPRTFWMRDTHVALDMIFVARDRTVAGVIENATPRTEEPREIDAAAQYVVEVNAGFARAHGIFAGVAVRFEDVPDVLPGAVPIEDDPEDEEEMEGWVE